MSSKTIPCPMCGSENEVGAAYCTVCGYHLQQQVSNAGGHKCARCGSRVPPGYDFCPVCGLDQRHRFARPATQVVNVGEDGSTPSQIIQQMSEQQAQPQPGQPPPGAGPAPDRTVPAPGLLQQPAPPPPSYPGGSPGGSPGQPGAGAYSPPGQPGYPHDPHAQHPASPQPYPGQTPPYASPPPGAPGGPPPPMAPPPPVVAAPLPGAPPRPASPSVTMPAPGGQAPAPPPAHPAPSEAVTGRTEFHQGPPLARPPRVHDDDLTVPVQNRQPAVMDPDDGPPTLPGDRSESMTTPGNDAAMHDAGPSESPAGPGGQHQEVWSLAGAAAPLPAGVDAPSPPPLVDAPPPAAPGSETPSTTPTKPGTVSARLVLVGRDGEEGDAFPMSGDAIDVGREQGAILFRDDAFMSPQHARIERSGDVFTLVDLGSTNGVYLRIRGNSAVYPGDLFMVGHQVLRLENVVEPVSEQAPGPDGTRSFGTPLKPAWGKLALVGRGGVAGDIYFLRGAKVIFGREQGDILFPHDPFVSREHARVRLELHGSQMAVFLEDLGSANGTYIRIRGSAEVRGRDTFRIGDQILRLRLDR